MQVAIFTAWLSLIPFVTLGGYYEGPKTNLFLLGGFALSIFWIFRLIKNQQLLKLKKKDYWFWIWIAILTTTSLFGVHPAESIIGGSYRHQGVIFFLTLWLIGKTVGLFDSSEKRLLNKGAGLVVIAEAIIVFYQLIFGKLYLGRPLGTLGEVNAVAGFLAIGMYFIIVSFPKIYSLLPIAAIVLTESRSGILAILPNLGFQINLIGRKMRALLTGLCLLLVIFLFFHFSKVKGYSFFENREVIWPLAVQQIIKKPIFGYGAESGEIVFNNAFYESGFPLSDLIIDRAHNLFLDVAMWSGGIGLAVFLFWLYFSFIDLTDVRKKLAFLSFLVFSMFQPLSVVHWILFFLVL